MASVAAVPGAYPAAPAPLSIGSPTGSIPRDSDASPKKVVPSIGDLAKKPSCAVLTDYSGEPEVSESKDTLTRRGSASASASVLTGIESSGMESPPKKKSKPIIKSPLNKSRKKRRSVLQLQREEKAIHFVKVGGEVTKWTSSGRRLKRFAKVSEDGVFLEISSKAFLGLSSEKIRRIALADVTRVIMGPRTRSFDSFNIKKDAPWRCFSIMTSNRSWDFQLETDEDALNWFFGLQLLSPELTQFMSWGRLLWTTAVLRTLQVARKEKRSIAEVWEELVEIARERVAKEKKLLS